MKQAVVLVALALSACTPPTYETEGGIIETTDEMSVAQTGFPNAAIVMTRSAQLPDGTTLRAVQYDAALATQEMIDASPSALCAAWDLALISSRHIPPTSDYEDIANSMVIEAICK